MRSFIYLNITHAASSAVVMGYSIDAINRRLHRYTIDFLIAYIVVSLLILITTMLIRRFKNGVLTALVLPYLAAAIAYAFVMGKDISRAIIRFDSIEYLGLLGIFLIFPYLVAWGPVISLMSALTLWL